MKGLNALHNDEEAIKIIGRFIYLNKNKLIDLETKNTIHRGITKAKGNSARKKLKVRFLDEAYEQS